MQERTTAYNAIGTPDGTHVGGVTVGKRGATSGHAAAEFNGSTGVLDLGNSTRYDSPIGTMEAWVKTSTPEADYRTVMVKQQAFALYIKDGVFMTYDWLNGADRSTGVNVADGQWHHLAMTYRHGVANGSTLYIDGVAVLTTTTGRAQATYPLYVGGTVLAPASITSTGPSTRPQCTTGC